MNASIRFIFNLKLSDDRITEYMKKCHFLPVKAYINYKICLLVYKNLNDSAPIYQIELIKWKDSLAFLKVYENNSLFYKLN